jgi:hypothetical protein
MSNKTCTKCNIVKPINLFTKDSRKKDGHVFWCKDCRREHAVLYRKRMASIVKKVDKSYKYCYDCKNTYSAYEFGKDKSRVDGLKAKCKNCELVYNRGRKSEPAIPYSLSKRYSEVLSSAKRRNLIVTITFDEYKILIKDEKCDYCENSLPPFGGGLDRKNNTKSYEIDNVVPCCTECNKLKGDILSYKEMKHIAIALKQFRSNYEN